MEVEVSYWWFMAAAAVMAGFARFAMPNEGLRRWAYLLMMMQASTALLGIIADAPTDMPTIYGI